MAGIAWPASRGSTSTRTSPVQRSTTAWWKSWSSGPSMKSRWHPTMEQGWEPSAGLWQSTHCREVSKPHLYHPASSHSFLRASAACCPTLEPEKSVVTSVKVDRQLGAGSTANFKCLSRAETLLYLCCRKSWEWSQKLSVWLTPRDDVLPHSQVRVSCSRSNK